MKFISLLLAILIARSNTFGQCDTAIIGKWRIVSIFNGEIYVNFKTDSVFVTHEAKQSFTDTVELNSFVATAKEMFRSLSFLFQKNGVYKTFIENYDEDSGTYCFKHESNILQLTSNEFYGKIMQEPDQSFRTAFYTFIRYLPALTRI
jgi:hypothetical protein